MLPIRDPMYRRCGSVGEKTTGDVQVKRYFRSDTGCPPLAFDHGAMSRIW
jgi:hypothetical protein